MKALPKKVKFLIFFCVVFVFEIQPILGEGVVGSAPEDGGKGGASHSTSVKTESPEDGFRNLLQNAETQNGKVVKIILNPGQSSVSQNNRIQPDEIIEVRRKYWWMEELIFDALQGTNQNVVGQNENEVQQETFFQKMFRQHGLSPNCKFEIGCDDQLETFFWAEILSDIGQEMDVPFLLSQVDFDFNQTYKEGTNILHLLAKKNKVEYLNSLREKPRWQEINPVLKRLLRTRNTPPHNDKSFTPFEWALVNARSDDVKNFLDLWPELAYEEFEIENVNLFLYGQERHFDVYRCSPLFLVLQARKESTDSTTIQNIVDIIEVLLKNKDVSPWKKDIEGCCALDYVFPLPEYEPIRQILKENMIIPMWKELGKKSLLGGSFLCATAFANDFLIKKLGKSKAYKITIPFLAFSLWFLGKGGAQFINRVYQLSENRRKTEEAYNQINGQNV